MVTGKGTATYRTGVRRKMISLATRSVAAGGLTIGADRSASDLLKVNLLGPNRIFGMLPNILG